MPKRVEVGIGCSDSLMTVTGMGDVVSQGVGPQSSTLIKWKCMEVHWCPFVTVDVAAGSVTAGKVLESPTHQLTPSRYLALASKAIHPPEASDFPEAPKPLGDGNLYAGEMITKVLCIP